MSILTGANNTFLVTAENGGNQITGWESVSITRTLDAAAGTFTLDVYDNAPEYLVDVNLPIEIFIDDNKIITGWVDNEDISISSNSYSYSVSGRDKTADIIDCSQIDKPFVFSNQTLGQVAEKLCSPFGIKVIKKTDTDIYKSLTIEQGQAIYTFLDEYAQKQGYIINSNVDGDLVIYNPTNFKTLGNIVEGYNVLSLSKKTKLDGLYSDYMVKGKSQYTNAISTIKDMSIKRYRPILITPEKPVTNKTAKERAVWEKLIRISRSISINITLDSWYLDEKIILPGYIVNLDSSTLRFNSELLIKTVTYNLSNSEYTADLELVDPKSYETENGQEYKALKKDSKDRAVRKK